ncbi:hypothetical protein LEMLEM_LOCUS11068 [Lemmus lemmus]
MLVRILLRMRSCGLLLDQYGLFMTMRHVCSWQHQSTSRRH